MRSGAQVAVAEANKETLTAQYFRKALGMGLKFDESMTSAAYVDNEVRSSTYGQITIGKSFFVGGNTTPELAKHYPGYSSWLTRQPLRSWQMFVAIAMKSSTFFMKIAR